MKRLAVRLLVPALLFAGAGCSLGSGEGEVWSDKLVATACWDQAYDLRPDFFASIPYQDSQSIRVQRGSDTKEVSDGVAVEVDETSRLRTDYLGTAIPVRLPAGVAPPGSLPDPCGQAGCDGSPAVSVVLYLHSSCHNQIVALYGIGGTITFDALFNGDPNEGSAEEKFTSATFDVQIGDPRDAPLGAPAWQVPAELQSQLQGWFEFYFERGRPAQPFP